MKFQHYLNEKITKEETIINLIRKDCQPFIKKMARNFDNEILFVSGRSLNKDFIKYPIRKDRKPTDTAEYIHKKMDELLYKKIGVKPRSNGLFCYPEDINKIDKNNQYGLPYFVFPIGDFSVAYNPEVYDLFWYLNKIFRKHAFNNDFVQTVVDDVEPEERISYDDSGADRVFYTNQGFYVNTKKWNTISKKEFLDFIDDILKDVVKGYKTDILGVQLKSEVSLIANSAYLLFTGIDNIDDVLNKIFE